MTTKIPVTVLTGFLGSGKTTLLNRILTENHGQRIAVIENEFGEIGVDQDLVINADEEIFEMNNGCICCTVRGDLIRILGSLARRKDRFDRIVLETTGMADPGPVAQTFFVDDEIRDEFYLDGIITLVDARHVTQHLDGSEEAQAQIAFADRIVLNKTDLVDSSTQRSLKNRLQELNRMAEIIPAEMAAVALDKVLDVGGFDLNRALETNPAFLEPEYPFEWGGIYDLEPGSYRLELSQGPDPEMSAILVPLLDKNESGEKDLQVIAETAFRYFSQAAKPLQDGEHMSPGTTLWELQLQLEQQTEFSFPVDITAAGNYALFTQHTPEEFSASLKDSAGQTVKTAAEHFFNAGHTHDDTVSSIAFEFGGSLDAEKLNAWMSVLLETQGADLFRMKGILSIADDDRRVIFQGVHMLLDSQPGAPWNNEPRNNRLVFIGRNLNRDYLQGGLKRCMV